MKPRWHRIADRKASLPPSETTVLVYYADGTIVTTWWEPDGWGGCAWDYPEAPAETPTHWMPLPDPPDVTP